MTIHLRPLPDAYGRRSQRGRFGSDRHLELSALGQRLRGFVPSDTEPVPSINEFAASNKHSVNMAGGFPFRPRRFPLV